MQHKTLIEDILIYLPNWTNKPITHHKKHHHHPPKNNDENHKVPSFIDEFSTTEEIHSDFDYRKHISNEEILKTYHRTRIRVASWLNRKEVPHTIDCYNATCMWTAGTLEEKYTFKDTRHSPLIDEAKEMLEPWVSIYFRVLNKQCTHHNNHHIHMFNNTVTVNVTEVFECLEDTST